MIKSCFGCEYFNRCSVAKGVKSALLDNNDMFLHTPMNVYCAMAEQCHYFNYDPDIKQKLNRDIK